MDTDRRKRRKRRFADSAKKKAKLRSRRSHQRVTMVTISEPDPGLSEEPEDTSLDQEETRKRRFALWLHITVIVSIGLLSILLISLRFNSPSPWGEGRQHLIHELDELTLQGWMFYDNSFYLISTTEKSWTASREDCLQRNADLVVINSREEQGFVSRLMGPSWIGLSDRDTEGTFKWVDGTPMTSSWRQGKPHDDGGAEDCVVAGEGGWSEEPCDRLHHWICEKVVDLDHLEAERNKEGSVMPTKEEAPSITAFHSSTDTLPVGQTARFTCDASGTPEPTVEWLHNGRPLERNGTDNQSEAWVERGFLFVRGVRYGVNTVCCRASNSAGTANHTAELLVFVMPTEEEEAPSITEFHSSTQRLPVGQTARLTCNAGGTPEPTVEWLHNGKPLERDGTDDQSEAWVERGFLFVRGVRYGVNTVCCKASNSAGTANHTAELIVFDACELTLDPNTAYRRLSLSEDRKVTRFGEYQSYPDHPERFDSWVQVLGREALTGRCYWEVEWKGTVVIGVTYRGITRRGASDCGLGWNNMSWSLVCEVDGGYSALYNGSVTFIRPTPAGSAKVGVYLDRPAGTLSFYRVSPGGGGSTDTLTHLNTFQATFTQEDLLPGFGLSEEGDSVSLCRL